MRSLPFPPNFCIFSSLCKHLPSLRKLPRDAQLILAASLHPEENMQVMETEVLCLGVQHSPPPCFAKSAYRQGNTSCSKHLPHPQVRAVGSASSMGLAEQGKYDTFSHAECTAHSTTHAREQPGRMGAGDPTHRLLSPHEQKVREQLLASSE